MSSSHKSNVGQEGEEGECRYDTAAQEEEEGLGLVPCMLGDQGSRKTTGDERHF